jgi:serine/threonine-protein kinase
MGDVAGATFAGHEVHDVIGTDLVSTVYRATAPDEDRTVSLRIVAQDLCVIEGPDRQLYRRFRAQATASLTFEHPHSPTVEEVGEHHGQGYLVAPFVDAIPLSELVAGHSPLEVGTALDLFEQVADVLDSGQQAGLTHGAVNPSTLSFARPGWGAAPDAAYLTGYGVGALLELRLKRDRKQLTVVDDLLYVAPEQLRQQTVTGRTDQYALACALLHVLTGEPPFARDSIGGLFGAHLFVEPELDESLPWAAAVQQGMAKEPEERFTTCSELITAVRAGVAAAATRAPARFDVPDATRTRRVTAPEPQTAVGQQGPELSVRRRERPPAADPRRAPRPSQARPQPVAVDVDTDADADVDADAERSAGATVFTTAAPTEARNGTRRHVSWPDDDDAPLLSEVLSQHETRRRSGLRSPAVIVLLLAGVLGIAAAAVWFLS